MLIDLATEPFDSIGVQTILDNFDDIISSENYQKLFHGLAKNLSLITEWWSNLLVS